MDYYKVFFFTGDASYCPTSDVKKILRLTLLNDCHLSYQRIGHTGLDGLLCCVWLINLQTQQLSPSFSNSFSIHGLFFKFLKKYLASTSFCRANLGMFEHYIRKQKGKGIYKDTMGYQLKFLWITSIIYWQHRIITLLCMVTRY